MRKQGVENFEIDWAKFDGQQKQYKEEADYAKANGNIDVLVCMTSPGSHVLNGQYLRFEF